MKLYTVRIPGYRLIVSAASVWDAIDQVLNRFPGPRTCSAMVIA